MQLKHALLPIAVLAFSGIFLAKRQFAVTEKRHSMDIYRETIRTVAEHRAMTGAAAAAKAEADKAAGPPVVTKDSINLKSLAKSMADMRGNGFPDMQTMIRAQKSILGLSAADLSDLIADTARLNLPEDQKNGLAVMLLQGLAQKDARAAVLAGQALAQAAGGPRTAGLSMGVIQPAFVSWVRQDPAAALQWYDGEVAAGHFENRGLDSVNHVRAQFESGLLPGLAERDPAAAAARLMAMPDDQRAAVLAASQAFGADAAGQKAFASLVRSTLPADRQAESLATMASSLRNGSDFKNVSAFLETAAVTPEEKAGILPQVAGRSLRGMTWGEGGPLTYENAVPVLAWLEREQPGGSGKAMGESLADIIGSGTFDQAQAVGLITRLHESRPSDELILSFLSRARLEKNSEASRALAEKIRNPDERRKMLELLASRP